MKPAIVRQLSLCDDGLLSETETVALFQALINTGDCWNLEARYGHIAMALIREGRCALGTEPHVDAWRNPVPARRFIHPGEVGSAEFVEATTGAPPLDGGIGS
jgi:hypothetical protein